MPYFPLSALWGGNKAFKLGDAAQAKAYSASEGSEPAPASHWCDNPRPQAVTRSQPGRQCCNFSMVDEICLSTLHRFRLADLKQYPRFGIGKDDIGIVAQRQLNSLCSIRAVGNGVTNELSS